MALYFEFVIGLLMPQQDGSVRGGFGSWAAGGGANIDQA